MSVSALSPSTQDHVFDLVDYSQIILGFTLHNITDLTFIHLNTDTLTMTDTPHKVNYGFFGVFLVNKLWFKLCISHYLHGS